MREILAVLAVLLVISLWQWVLALAVIWIAYLLYTIWDIAGQESERYKDNSDDAA